jgi:hypothetical protein
MILNILYCFAGLIRTEHYRTDGILGRYEVTMSSALQRVVSRLKAASCDKDCYSTLRQLIPLSAGHLYRVSQEEGTKLREGVPYVKLYRYNPKHLYPKLNGLVDNGQ